MPPAARLTDMHTCPMVTGTVPHVGGPILPPCEPTVLIGMMPAARVGDMATCVGPPDNIIKGSMTVLIGNKPAARIGDNTAHGGVIVSGCPTVLIGDQGGGGGSGGGGGGGGGGTSQGAGGGADGAAEAEAGPAQAGTIQSGKITAGRGQTPTTPAKPPQRTGCSLLTLTLQCQHTPKKPRMALVVTEVSQGTAATLSVVPSEDSYRSENSLGVTNAFEMTTGGQPLEPDDKIDLTLTDQCTECKRKEHPQWSISGAPSPPVGSRKGIVPAKSWTTGKAFPWIPNVSPHLYSIVVRSCQNSLQAQIKAYPCDKLELTFDVLALWEILSSIVENGLKKAAGEWVSEVKKSFDPAKKALKGKTKAAVKKAQQTAGQEAAEKDEKPGGKLARKLGMNQFDLGIEGQWTAKWAEHQDHRAYYQYELDLRGTAEGRWEWRFTLLALIPGLQWYAALPSSVREQLVDCYLFFAITGSLSLGGHLKRAAPEAPLYQERGIELKGEPIVGVEAGGAAVIAGGKIGKVSAYFSTGVDVTGFGGMDAEGWCVKGSIAWSGLSGTLEAVLFDDTIFEISAKKEYVLIPPSDPIEKRWPEAKPERAS